MNGHDEDIDRQNQPSPSADQPQRSTWKGRMLVITAALMWSTSGLFVKAKLFDDWTPAQQGPLLAFWRSLFAAVILIPLIRRPRWNPLLPVLGGVFSVMCLVYMVAIVMTTATCAIWLQATAPWWVFLISVFALHQAIDRRDLITLPIALIGIVFILTFEARGENFIGVLAGLASGITFGGVLMMLRKLNRMDGAWLIVICHGSTAAVLLPVMLWIGIWPSPLQLGILLAFGAIQMGIPYVLLARGFRSIHATEAAILLLIEPITMPYWVYLAYAEVPDWWTVTGAALIFAALLLRLLLSQKTTPK